MSMARIKKFNSVELSVFLDKHGLSEFSGIVENYEIDGEKFLKLSELEMRLWRPKISQVQVRKLLAFQDDLKKNPGKFQPKDKKPDVVVLVEDKLPISKTKLTKLYNDDKFMRQLKNAYEQKQEKPEVEEIYENCDQNPELNDDFNQEIYENTGTNICYTEETKISQPVVKEQQEETPFLPPKPKMQSKVKMVKRTHQNQAEPTQFEQNSKNIAEKLKHPMHPKPIVQRKPELHLKPNDLDEDYLESEIPQIQKESSTESIPEYLDMDPKKKTKRESDDEYLEPSDFDVSKLGLPQQQRLRLPLPKTTAGYDTPMNVKKTQNDEKHDRYKTEKSRKYSMQEKPLPARPSFDFSSLPRPPKVPDAEVIRSLGKMTLEDFNFQQSFVAKYSSAKFYRYTDKKGADELLSRRNIKEGTFLLRPSNKNYCAMAVKHPLKVYHLAVNMNRNNTINICGKNFADLEEMLEYFQTQPMTFPEMVQIRLRSPLSMNIT